METIAYFLIFLGALLQGIALVVTVVRRSNSKNNQDHQQDSERQ